MRDQLVGLVAARLASAQVLRVAAVAAAVKEVGLPWLNSGPVLDHHTRVDPRVTRNGEAERSPDLCLRDAGGAVPASRVVELQLDEVGAGEIGAEHGARDLRRSAQRERVHAAADVGRGLTHDDLDSFGRERFSDLELVRECVRFAVERAAELDERAPAGGVHMPASEDRLAATQCYLRAQARVREDREAGAEEDRVRPEQNERNLDRAVVDHLREEEHVDQADDDAAREEAEADRSRAAWVLHRLLVLMRAGSE